MKKRLIATVLAAFLFCALALPALAVDDDDETSGLAADTLTVTVGYFGGPYYEKAVFSLDELWALDVQYVDYTFIDNMPSVVISHVAGITLADLLDASGIDLGSVQSFNFWTNDKAGGYYTSLTKSYLIDTPRYAYYSLPDNFDYDLGAGNEYATLDAVRVPTMIALADDWRRVIAGASFGSDYANLNTNTRFRLVFGQTDAVTRTASNSAKWVHKIEITLGGAPTVTLDASVLDLEVGSKFRSEAYINAADVVIAAQLEIEWSSSDESIATVDANGEITVHAEGSATITARIGDSVATMVVNGSPGEVIQGNSGSGGSTGGELSTNDANPAPSTDTNPVPTGSTPSETVTELTPNTSQSTIIGREISILPPPAAQSEGDGGGVQNWRVGEMSATAVELPIIAEDNPMLVFVLTAAIAVLFLGGGTEFIRYRKQMGGFKNAE